METSHHTHHTHPHYITIWAVLAVLASSAVSCHGLGRRRGACSCRDQGFLAEARQAFQLMFALQGVAARFTGLGKHD